jgi:hypothetical protein
VFSTDDEAEADYSNYEAGEESDAKDDDDADKDGIVVDEETLYKD